MGRAIEPAGEGRIQVEDFGVQTPPSTEILFNLLGFFEKDPKTPQCGPFKKNLNPFPQKISEYAYAAGTTI